MITKYNENGDNEGVSIPHSTLHMLEEQFRELQSQVLDVETDDGNHGMNL